MFAYILKVVHCGNDWRLKCYDYILYSVYYKKYKNLISYRNKKNRAILKSVGYVYAGGKMNKYNDDRVSVYEFNEKKNH